MISLTHDNEYEELKNNLKLAPGPLFTVACAPLFPRFLAVLAHRLGQRVPVTFEEVPAAVARVVW